MNRPSVPEVYFSASILPLKPMTVVVRSGLPADQTIGAVRRTIREANPLVTMGDVRTMDDVVGDTLQLQRLSSMIMTFFGLAALLMAALGIYGVVSYFVRHRTVELGTRMALGADNRDLVARMNQFVYQSTPASKYATFCYAHFDGGRRQLRYVNAGHNAPFLWRAATDSTSPEIEQLSVGGTVIGMFPDMSYEEATVELRPGDVLLVFTDGVPEAHDAANEEFGDERLQQLLSDTAHLTAAGISAPGFPRR